MSEGDAEYEQILALRTIALDHFDERQREAGAALAEIVATCGARSVWDLGCGAGEHLVECAKLLPEVRFHGVDPSQAMVTRANAGGAGLDNLRFSLGGLPDVRIDVGVDLLWSVGHTVPHFGAGAFSAWLDAQTGRQPVRILIDLVANWERVLATRVTIERKAEFLPPLRPGIGELATLVTPDAVWRILSYRTVGDDPDDRAPVSAVAVPQVPDTMAAYAASLVQRGYASEREIRYQTGWGAMSARMFLREECQ